MKKLLLIISILAITFSSKAQTKFVSPFASYSSKTMSYGAEAGLCFKNTWLSTSYTYTPSSKSHFAGINLYNRIIKDERLSLYTYNSCKANLNTGYLFYEPGLSAVYDLTLSLCPQFTVTLPVIKNTSLSYTLSLMYNF